MIEVSRDIPADAQDVFAVLADGWSYAAWVVGNSHIRDVDADWPAPGTRIHHSAGAWPLQIQDVTEVRSVEANRFLELKARLWLLGAVSIRFSLSPLTHGGTRVVMAEQAVAGVGALIPEAVQGLALRPRNRESLTRLGDLAVGRGTHVPNHSVD